MTAGTVVITGGILATVILLCIIAVLCYCRLQYYCCKKEESESEEEEEPDFAVTSRLPPVHSNHNIVAASAAASNPNGPTLFTPPLARKLTRSQTFCPSCTHHELPFLPAAPGWTAERRRPHQLPQCPATRPGPALRNAQLPQTQPDPVGHHEGHVQPQLQHQH
ncbi:unnamed protein product [Coregonus sp. 'balchen']|nr:unnamed protein product [Coregonus sp. 'balchen']